MTERRRSRRRGRGALYRYKTAAGERWRWQLTVPVDPEDPSGEQRRASGGGFRTMDEADDALREAVRKLRAQEVFAANRGAPTIAVFAEQWLGGLALAPSTLQGYAKIVRNHLTPHIGDVQVDKLTSTRIARLYRDLRTSGRRDGVHTGEPLSANSVQKVHIVLGAILEAAVDDRLISSNPARRGRTVKAPTGKQVRAARPEIETWTAEELRAFLDWDRASGDDLHTLWLTIAHTGVRRSEALAIRWADVDLVHGRLSVRRAADVTVRNVVKTTKGGKSRALELDAITTAALKAWKAARGSISLEFARPDAYVFGNLANEVRSPNEVGRRWTRRVERAQDTVPDLPRITLKGLRHTHATLMLAAGVHPKVVQERLGHASVMITMDIYSHVTPTVQRAAADRFADLLGGA